MRRHHRRLVYAIAASAAIICSIGATDPTWGSTECVKNAGGNVDSCLDCCQERKCGGRCLDKCKDAAEDTALARKSYCKDYDGYKTDSSRRKSLQIRSSSDGGSCRDSKECKRCQGKCTKDSHCDDSLECFPRDGYEDIPGCKGDGVYDANYCYDPNDERDDTTNSCSDDLGYYRSKNCGSYSKCVKKHYRDELADDIADDAWDWCMDLRPPNPPPRDPSDCGGFASCVYNYELQEYAIDEKQDAYKDCTGGDISYGSYAKGSCDHWVKDCITKRTRRNLASSSSNCWYRQDWGKCCCNGKCDGDNLWTGPWFQCSGCPNKTCGLPEPEPEPECTDDQCKEYSECVYYWAVKQIPSDAVATKTKAYNQCNNGLEAPSYYAKNKCDKYLGYVPDVPDWHPKSRYWDDWHGAGSNGDCDDILKDLQEAWDRSSSKAKDVCNDYSYCVHDYEKTYSYSKSNEYGEEKASDSKQDCNRCDDWNCKSSIGDDYASGQCDSDLGGWERTCSDYEQCWLSRLKGECNDCSASSNRNKDRCRDTYGNCYNGCMSTRIDACEAECDVCWCDYGNAALAVTECIDIKATCCNDPYGWLDDDDMKDFKISGRGCSDVTCGHCTGHCSSDSHCTNTNICSIYRDRITGETIRRIPNDEISGCRGNPALVAAEAGRDPATTGYCYNPNKEYPSRDTVTNDCLFKKSNNSFGICCDLPVDSSQCDTEISNFYCPQFDDSTGESGAAGDDSSIIVEPPTEEPPTNKPPVDDNTSTIGNGCATPPGVDSIVASFCGRTYQEICCSCPPPVDCATNGCPNVADGCFQGVTIPCPSVEC